MSPAPGYIKRRAKWTRDEVIDAIKVWAELHGGQPPTSTEWNPSDCRYSAELSAARASAWLHRAGDFESGEYPWTGTVQKLFDSWNDAIRTAGFVPRRATILDGAYERAGPRRQQTLATLRDAVDTAVELSGEERRQALYQVAEHALMLAHRPGGKES